MQKIDRDGDPATDPEIVVTAQEARAGIGTGRILTLLVVSVTLAVIGLYAAGLFGPI